MGFFEGTTYINFLIKTVTTNFDAVQTLSYGYRVAFSSEIC